MQIMHTLTTVPNGACYKSSVPTLQACELLEGLIPSKNDKTQVTAEHLEKLFIFSLMWSIGALLELDDRARMEEFLVGHQSGLDLPPVKEGQTIFEYVPDAKGIYNCI